MLTQNKLDRLPLARISASPYSCFPTGGLYYKTLRTCNLREMDRFSSKLLSLCCLGQTH